jgi:cullin-4
MVLHKFGEFLYSNLESHMADHLRSLRTKLTPEMSKGNGFLSVINKAWSQYCDQLLLIRNLFLSLDRKFTIANAGVKSVWCVLLYNNMW